MTIFENNMNLVVFAIYNETQKKWYTVGHTLAPEPCLPFTWYDKAKAEKKLEQNDYFYGWTESGDKMVIKEFNLVPKSAKASA